MYGHGSVSAQSDVYSLAATFYHLLTGQMPPDSQDVLIGNLPPARPAGELRLQVSLAVSHAVQRGMQLERTDRPRSVQEFKAALSYDPAAHLGMAATPLSKPQLESISAATRPRPKLQPAPQRPLPIGPLVYLWIFVAILLLLILAWLLAGRPMPFAPAPNSAAFQLCKSFVNLHSPLWTPVNLW